MNQDIQLIDVRTPNEFFNGTIGKAQNINFNSPLFKEQVLKLNKNKEIEDLSFEGEGCAISLASASILTETIKGKDFDSAKKITSEFLEMIKDKRNIKDDNLNEDQKTKIMSLSGVKEYPMRVKCATLSWHTLISAIDNTQEEINTEKLD